MQILFVEDNPMNRRIIGEMLAAAGLPMDEAESASEGLTLLDCKRYDLILMDVRMPGVDGLTATRAIRARRDDKASTPIVIVTADTGADLRRECLASGANELLTKPVMMNSLFDIIGKVLAANQSDLVLI